MKTNEATAEVFYRAFKSLTSGEREAFIGKVLNDIQLREDLFDIALIKEAKKARGKSMSAREYFAKRSKE